MSAESVARQLFGIEGVIAAQAVAEAACLARWVQREGAIGTLSKSDASPVTVADFAVQALVAGRLAAACPDVPLVAEEDGTQLRNAAAADVRDAVLDVLMRFGLVWMPNERSHGLTAARGVLLAGSGRSTLSTAPKDCSGAASMSWRWR